MASSDLVIGYEPDAGQAKSLRRARIWPRYFDKTLGSYPMALQFHDSDDWREEFLKGRKDLRLLGHDRAEDVAFLLARALVLSEIPTVVVNLVELSDWVAGDGPDEALECCLDSRVMVVRGAQMDCACPLTARQSYKVFDYLKWRRAGYYHTIVHMDPEPMNKTSLRESLSWWPGAAATFFANEYLEMQIV